MIEMNGLMNDRDERMNEPYCSIQGRSKQEEGILSTELQARDHSGVPTYRSHVLHIFVEEYTD